MNEEQTDTLSLRAAYAFAAANGLENEANDIREMIIEWDSSYTSSLRRGYIVDLFEKRGIFDAFKREHWPFGNTSAGDKRRLRLLRIKAQYEAFLAGRGPDPVADNRGMSRPIRGRNSSSKLTFVTSWLGISIASSRDFDCINLRNKAGLNLRLMVAASTCWRLIGVSGSL